MKIKFYLQYFSYNDENFEVSDNYYQNSSDYIKSLEENYNQTKDVIFEAISSGSYLDKNTFKMPLEQRIEQKSDNYSYTSCEGVIIDEGMDEMEENSFNILNIIQDVFVGIIKLDYNTIEEEFETNWRMFLDSTKKIMNYDTDDDWKFKNKPTKDIYFSFINKDNEEKYGKFCNCRIENITNSSEVLLIIEKLVFVDKIE